MRQFDFLRQKLRHVAHWIDWKKSKYYNKIFTEKSDTYTCPVKQFSEKHFLIIFLDLLLWKTLFDNFSWVIFLYLLCHFFHWNCSKFYCISKTKKNLKLKINTIMLLTYNQTEVALFDKCSNFKLMNWVARTWVHKNHIFPAPISYYHIINISSFFLSIILVP